MGKDFYADSEDRQIVLRNEADERQADHDKRTPNQQLAFLGDHRALKERTILNAWVNDDLGDTPIHIIKSNKAGAK